MTLELINNWSKKSEFTLTKHEKDTCVNSSSGMNAMFDIACIF